MATPDLLHDQLARQAAMAYVRALADDNGGVVTRDQLQQFVFEGDLIKLLDTGRGIRNPRQLAATLTILTTVNSSYDDTPGEDGLLRYAIREGELGQGDNRKLQRAYELGVPLIWLKGIAAGVFVPYLPVYLVAEDKVAKQYSLALGEDQRLMVPRLAGSSASEAALARTLTERRYVGRMSLQRLHQPAFRAGVMLAYQTKCAVCSLRHGELLDAAHIIEDGAEGGDPVVPNGLSLCKIHHAAYDGDLLGVSPERVVHINAELLQEIDGPMLRHGLQEFHRQPLRVVPSRRVDQPDPDRLAQRFERFQAAG